MAIDFGHFYFHSFIAVCRYRLCDHFGVMQQIRRGWSLIQICGANPCESSRLHLVLDDSVVNNV